MKNYQNARILHDSCLQKIVKIPKFYDISPKNKNKIPGFYMIFAPKMPEFYIIIARKKFFPEFWGHVAVWGTSPTPMVPNETNVITAAC